jgi:RNA polymerase sigma-70 factor, ECF subfamily
MTASDESLTELLSRSAQGDSVALRTLYDHTAPQLFAVLLRIIQRSDLAQEALQDVFISIWRNASAYSAQRGRPMSWMISIARYRAIDVRRSSKHDDATRDLSQVEEVIAAQDADVIEQVDLAVDAQRLSDCMERLSPEQDKCIRLAFLDGLSHEEISRKVSSPMGTVKSWVRRGLRVLKDCLTT